MFSEKNTIQRLILIVALGISFTFTTSAFCQNNVVADEITSQIRAIEALPSGTAFTLTLTAEQAQISVDELFLTNKSELEKMLKDLLGVGLSVSDPKISFSEDTIEVSVKAGIGFIKATATTKIGAVFTAGELNLSVLSLSLPVVSVSVEEANTYIQPYLNIGYEELKNNITIQTLKVSDGKVDLSAIRK